MNKQCQVCGDKAIGFNFKGLSCASCKSFFLRNAIRHEELRCEGVGKCLITQKTRKFCSRCRLDKCTRIGMDRELIRNKINSYNCRVKSCKVRIVTKYPISITSYIDSSIESLILQNRIHKNFHLSISSSSDSSAPLTPKINLTNLETEMINDVRYNASLMFAEECTIPPVACATDLIYVLNLYELYGRKTIKFCKNINAFKVTDQENQMALVKSFFSELIIIRMVYSFELEKDGFTIIKDDLRKQSIFVPLNVLLPDETSYQSRMLCRHFIAQLGALLDQDPIVRDLILMQQLFNPENDSLNRPELIRYEHCKYRRLLERYLEQKHVTCERKAGLTQFTKLLHHDMPKMKSLITALFVQSDKSLLAHLLNELFR